MRVAAAGLLCAFIAACGLLPSAPPEWVTNRQPLPACGTEAFGHGEGVDRTARQCLFAAYQDGRGAELITDATTVEGDPIRHYVRVHENGTVEIFVDATRDRFGSGEWGRLRCDALEPFDGADLVFAEVGCEELPLP